MHSLDSLLVFYLIVDFALVTLYIYNSVLPPFVAYILLWFFPAELSKARKDALRPIFSVPAVLRHDPTSTSILGSQDLATICDKANKESLALKRVFRPITNRRARFKFGKVSQGRYRGRIGQRT